MFFLKKRQAELGLPHLCCGAPLTHPDWTCFMSAGTDPGSFFL